MQSGKLLRWSRRLSFVPRWGVVPTIRKQSVAEHSYNTAMLANYIVNYHEYHANVDFRLSVLREALEHDVEEAAYGDPPGTSKTKKDYAALEKERGQVYIVVKAADVCEAMLFITEEILMGNTFGMHQIFDDMSGELAEIMGVMETSVGLEPSDLWNKMYADVYQHKWAHPALEAKHEGS